MARENYKRRKDKTLNLGSGDPNSNGNRKIFGL